MKLNKKMTSLFAALALSTGFMVGCGTDNEPKEEEKVETPATEDQVEEQEADGVSTASLSNDPAALVKGLSAEGGWIFAATGDMTVAEPIIVEGEFHIRGNEDEDVKRKLGLYTQDEDRNVEDEFTVTAEQGITVKSPNFTIVHGTIVGDIIVEAEGFHLDAAKVDGNITFASEEIKETATIDGEVTGEISVK